MNERVVIPTKQELHPVTVIMLGYLNDTVGMKKLSDWKDFFYKKKDKNSLSKRLLETATSIIEGEEVEEVDFSAMMWIILQFNRTSEEEATKIKLEKEIRKLKTELRKMVKG